MPSTRTRAGTWASTSRARAASIPYRVKIRGPSFVNLAVTGELCRNVLLADVPAIIGSIDIVMGEVDR